MTTSHDNILDPIDIVYRIMFHFWEFIPSIVYVLTVLAFEIREKSTNSFDMICRRGVDQCVVVKPKRCE